MPDARFMPVTTSHKASGGVESSQAASPGKGGALKTPLAVGRCSSRRKKGAGRVVVILQGRKVGKKKVSKKPPKGFSHHGRSRGVDARRVDMHGRCIEAAPTERLLELGNLGHHGEGVLGVALNLLAEFGVFLADALELVAHLFPGVRGGVLAGALPLTAGPFAVAIATGVIAGRGAALASVDTSKVFVQVLLSREAFAGMSLAGRVWAVDGVLGTAVLAVYFPLVS